MHRLLLLPLLFLLACTHLALPDGTEVHTAGSGSVTVTTTTDGDDTVTEVVAESDGTNVLGVFDVLGDVVKRFLGVPEPSPTVVNVNVPANPTEED